MCLKVNETVSQALRELTLREKAIMADKFVNSISQKKKQKDLFLLETNVILDQGYSKLRRSKFRKMDCRGTYIFNIITNLCDKLVLSGHIGIHDVNIEQLNREISKICQS
ncbi:hypothetical protein ACR3K2_14960 [Cryptosporidium serpentis]